jgi:tetratricopeptide (TPR) repeat protein
MINRGIQNWGSDGYKRSDDVCRFETTRQDSKQFKETLTFEFSNVKAERCDLVLSWENWAITIPIKANFNSRLRSQIEADLQSSNPNYWYDAAQFYYEYDHDLQAALEMINKAIDGWEKVKGKPYWQHHYKAKILKDLGRRTEALESALLSVRQARNTGIEITT